VLAEDGKFKNVGFVNLRRGEHMSEAFKQAVMRLLVWSADLKATDEKVKEEFDLALHLITAARRELKARPVSEAFTKLEESVLERWIIRS
jgi:hypothetical protein